MWFTPGFNDMSENMPGLAVPAPVYAKEYQNFNTESQSTLNSTK